MNILKRLLPIFILTGAILVFFYPTFFWPAVNITPTVGTNDLADTFYPERYFSIESIKRGEWPAWRANISSGHFFFPYALYPFSLIAFLLPLAQSVNLTLFSGFFLLALGSYFYFRQIKLSTLPSLFGALVITFSGFSVSRLIYPDMIVALAFLFWELYLWEKFFEKKKFIFVVLGGFALGLQILGGHPQLIFYGLLFLPFYVLFLNLKARINWLKLLLFWLVFLVSGVLIGIGQLWSNLESAMASTRSVGLDPGVILRFNFPFRDLVTFLVPYARFDPSQTLEAFHRNGWPQDERYVYMGILPLLLAIFALVTLVRKNARITFFALFGLLFLVLSFGQETALGAVSTWPPFNFFRLPLRFVMLTTISLSVLAAFGMEEVLKKVSRVPPIRHPSMPLRVKAQGKRVPQVSQAGRLIGGLLILLSFLDLWYFGSSWKLHPPVRAGDWYKMPEVVEFLKKNLQNQERVTTEYYYYPSAKIFLTQRHLWDESRTLINLRNLLPAYNNLLYNLPMNVGAANSGGLKMKRYNDLEQEMFFRGIKYVSLDKVEVSDSFLFLNRLMGVRYVLSSWELPQGLGLSKVYETKFDNGQDQIKAYEFFDYYLRAFIVPRAEVEAPEKIMEHLLKVDFDPRQTIFLEEKTDWGAEGALASTVQFEKYTDQEIIITTESSADGFLFLSDTYYPGWKAYISEDRGQRTENRGRKTDNRLQKTEDRSNQNSVLSLLNPFSVFRRQSSGDTFSELKIYRANYAFRAVEVPKGKHQIVFRYEPIAFWRALNVSIISGILMVLGIGALIFAELKFLKGLKFINR